jgi:hypothetical protein
LSDLLQVSYLSSRQLTPRKSKSCLYSPLSLGSSSSAN